MAKCHALLDCKNTNLHICFKARHEEKQRGAASSTDGSLAFLS